MRAKKASVQNSLPTWNLNDLYVSEDSPKFKADLKSLGSKILKFKASYQSKLTKLNGKALHQAIKSFEEIHSIIIKLQSFAFLHYVTDINDPKRRMLLQSVEEKITALGEHIVFFTLELNAIKDAELKSKLKTSTELKHYQPWLKKVRIWKKYELSEPEEKILLQKQLTSTSAWIKFYDQTLAKLRFSFNKEELNFTQIANKLTSSIEKDRKLAASSITKVFNEHADTFTFIMNTLVKDKELLDTKRGFAKPISSRNLANFIDDKVVDTLIDTVKANYPKLSHRYYKIKAKLLGKNHLNYWDRNAPLSSDQDTNIPWNEAKDIVLKAYQNFSPTFAKIAKQFFDHNWIDAQVKPSKQDGAFNHPTTTLVHPYIMLNYQGRNRDVMTLAHELGHGIHSMLAKPQGDLMSYPPLTLAETASVFGEQLVFRSLLEREKDAKKRKYLIANKVEDMLNTVVRQIAFCEFEKAVHDARKKGELSTKDIADIWFKTQAESFGDSIKLEDSYHCYWMYISHFFHVPFYVYAYAFGDCLVNSLYAVYEKGKIANFESKYIKMLSAGATFEYKDLLPTFGLDPYKADFWQQGLNKISTLIDLLEK